jgi:hypothetical protein
VDAVSGAMSESSKLVLLPSQIMYFTFPPVGDSRNIANCVRSVVAVTETPWPKPIEPGSRSVALLVTEPVSKSRSASACVGIKTSATAELIAKTDIVRSRILSSCSMWACSM